MLEILTENGRNGDRDGKVCSPKNRAHTDSVKAGTIKGRAAKENKTVQYSAIYFLAFNLV